MRNLYEILGISSDAGADEVRSAYRSKAKETHPDAGGSNEAFSEVFIAYEILIDEDRRRQYDETGSAEASSKGVLEGAKHIIEGLLSDLIQRDDVRYFDVIAVMTTNIQRIVGEKQMKIDALENRRRALIDLKDRFKPRLVSETYVHDVFESKLEAVAKSVAAERLSIDQLNAASAILKRYDFARENRPEATSSDSIDPTAFGRRFDPLLDTSELSSGNRKA